MNHEKFQELISLHIDNELDDAGSAQLYAHLATCDVCRKFMRTTMNVRTFIANQEFAEVSATLDRRVLDPSPATPVRSVVKEWFAPFWWMRISIPLPAAASLAFLILFCSLLISPLLAPSKTSQAISTKDLKNVPTEFRKQIDLYR